MSQSADPFRRPFEKQTLYPRADRCLACLEVLAVACGLIATVLRPSLLPAVQSHQRLLAAIMFGSLLFLVSSGVVRYVWSRARSSFLRRHVMQAAIAAVWAVGLIGIVIYEAAGGASSNDTGRSVGWSGLCIVLLSVAEAVRLTRRATLHIANPGVTLVGSFGVLVVIGTLLLMLPRARAHSQSADVHEGAPLMVALFTATSAACVTGLAVVPTDTYWSRTGQTVILGLFQIGGLGIMTFGAFFSLAAGRLRDVRETATMRDLLESEGLVEARRLLLAILGFTVAMELAGAVLLSGLWADRSWGDQTYLSLFHSISAFCNAGFSLTGDSLVGRELQWQVWGVLSSLIVIGGLGFAVHYNLLLLVRERLGRSSAAPAWDLPHRKGRLSLSSKLVLLTTAFLLVGGTLGYGLLESVETTESPGPLRVAANSWFQSVTFRTAGFNTVDHGALGPATKLFAAALMFIGASPGSTGGGVKTTCFALTLLVLFATLRGRNRVEVFGRTIPGASINRALAILFLGMVVLMTSTILLVLFERQPERFLDHLYEASSAFGTVGVSTGITPQLTPYSKLVIVATMFLGRVGPLTLLMALAGESRTERYDFPQERVTLG